MQSSTAVYQPLKFLVTITVFLPLSSNGFTAMVIKQYCATLNNIRTYPSSTLMHTGR